MFSEEIHNKHLLDFNQMKTVFEELKVRVSLMERSEHLPLSSLLVETGKKGNEGLSLSFIPLGNADFKHSTLLQFYSVISTPWKAENKDLLERLLPHLNSHVALGSYNFQENGEVFYRYLHVLSKYEPVDKEVIKEIFTLILFSINRNGLLLKRVLSGRKSLEKAIAELNR